MKNLTLIINFFLAWNLTAQNCDSITIENSLIPNAGFEELVTPGDEPNSHSQLYKAKDWVQATDATSDFFSAMFYPSRPEWPDMEVMPPPNGSDHYVGGGRVVDWPQTAPEEYIEYVGTCLNSPIIQQTQYTLNLLIGAPSMSSATPEFLTGNFVVLGIPHCNFPILGADCKEDDFEVIGSVSINIPDYSWEHVQIEIESAIDYPAIMFGMSCNTELPSGTNVYLVDDVVLVQGNPCEIDNCQPICLTQDIELEIDNTGSVTIDASQINNGSYDQCSDVIIEIDKETFTCQDMGENTVILSVTDESGNISSCEAIVTIDECAIIPCDSIDIENSLIPNADFEELVTPGDEPNGHSQLFKAKDWVQATQATSDFFSVTNYPDRPDINLFNPPPPNGSDHYVGGGRIVDHQLSSPEDYIEYVGACLDQPIVAGVDYTINFFLGCPDMTIVQNTPNELKDDFVVLGIPHCNFPISGYDCKEDDYELIGKISVNIPNNTWEYHQITLNATQDYPAIMLGISCNTVLEGGISNYFILDELVVVEGNPCEIDECPPTCVTQNIELEIDNTGSVTIDASQINNGSYDQCSDVLIEIDKETFTCQDMGANTVILTVTDLAGNSSTCEAIVTIAECDLECCALAEELSDTVERGFTTNNLICTEDDGVSITPLTNLFDCQQISRIIWGDGDVDFINGGNITTHYYQSNGAYLISIEVVSLSEQNDTCQIDYADLTVVHKNCDIIDNIEDIEDQIFKIYPIPSSDVLNIDISRNENGYNTKIVNIVGQEISTFDIPINQKSYQINLENIIDGMYFLILEDFSTGKRLESRFMKI